MQKLTLALALVGRTGFEVHNPKGSVHWEGTRSQFSGLATVCFLYVAIQQMSPGADIGFDLEKEYKWPADVQTVWLSPKLFVASLLCA